MKSSPDSFPNSPRSSINSSEVLSQFWEEMLLKIDADKIPVALKRIEKWTSTQPELTSVLCGYVMRYAEQLKGNQVEAAIDRIVRQHIVDDWEHGALALHFNRIKQTLLSHDRKDSLLIEYIRILQRGSVPANNTSEQFVLLRSGLVEIERGSLKVANSTYAEVFDLSWVEQQIPGITKPVAIISPSAASNRPSALSKLYSKVAIAACGIALLGAAVSSYMKESGGQAIAISESGSQLLVDQPVVESRISQSEEASASVPAPIVSEPAASESASTSTLAMTQNTEIQNTETQKAFFDNGEEHAKNSRWVLMMRQFCGLSPDSIYFLPAQKHLDQWSVLYPDDIQIAKDIVMQEKSGNCAIATE